MGEKYMKNNEITQKIKNSAANSIILVYFYIKK